MPLWVVYFIDRELINKIKASSIVYINNTQIAMFNRLLFFGDIILSRWIKAKMHHATTKTAYTIPIIDHVLI